MKTFKETTTSFKNSFGNLFVLLVVILMILPFFTTFNEFLTRIIEALSLFRLLEKVIVPYEMALVRTIISAFGVRTAEGTVAVIRDGVNSGTYIAWNCIGWQSMVILLVSLKSGLVRGFTTMSKVEVLIFALAGTFLMNLVRISTVLIMLYYLGNKPAFFFHDYLAVLISLLWLVFFWWFSYTFLLEKRT